VAERYITAAELAWLMGVSLSTVRRWTATGMPSETWGMARTRRYRAPDCIEWAQARVGVTPRRFTVADRKD
jgi:hypothetical protein